MSLKKEDPAENHQRGRRVPLKASNKDTAYSKPCDVRLIRHHVNGGRGRDCRRGEQLGKYVKSK